MSENLEKILAADEICPMLVAALAEKRPLPPADWSVAKLDEEVLKADKNYEPNQLLRQQDALSTALYYLVDFAVRMPERVDVSENNRRVGEMCRELAAEIVKITVSPDEVISKHGKLKSWLKAILAVQLCLIYREETEGAIARDKEAKRPEKSKATKKNDLFATVAQNQNWRSALAKNIWQKANAQNLAEASEQPSLF